MISLIAGAGLGRFDTSQLLSPAQQPGQQTQQNININAHSGNLVLSRQDEWLKSAGIDLAVTRTYNSRGELAGADGSLQFSFEESVVLVSGVLNTVGSVVERRLGDGSIQRFEYRDGVYHSTAGEGAHDSLRLEAAGWVFEEGTSGLQHRYENRSGDSWLLTHMQDRQGNEITIAYDSRDRVTSLEGQGGQRLVVSYSGDRVSGLLTQSDGHDSQHVHYAYDALGRLSQLHVDLTPDDRSITDGVTATTNYFYDGNSQRIARIVNHDGSEYQFQYDAEGRITSARSGVGANSTLLTFIYDGNRTHVTTVYDPENPASSGIRNTYQWLSDGKLYRHTSARDMDNWRLVTTYRYNDAGDLIRASKNSGEVWYYSYDDQGNRTREQGPGGQDNRYEYDGNNQLLETRELATDGSGAEKVTRYRYDDQGRLRFMVAADGSLTEIRWQALGPIEMLKSTIQYAERFTRSSGDRDDLADLTAWVLSSDGTVVSGVEERYDFRGQLARVTRYAENNARGSGIAESRNQERFIYDAQGNLLQTLKQDPSGALTHSKQFAYDGLHRTVRMENESGRVTTWDYLGNQIISENQAGLRVTQTRDSRGLMIEEVQQDMNQAGAQLARSEMHYDAHGRLKARNDGNGLQHFLYDERHRLIAKISALGEAIRHSYDREGRLTQTTQFAESLLETRLWRQLQAGYASDTRRNDRSLLNSTDWSIANADTDRQTHQFYNVKGELNFRVDADGYVTRLYHDGFGRRIAEEIFSASVLDAASLGDIKDWASSEALTSITDQWLDNGIDSRLTRFYYDAGDREVGILDAAGYLRTKHYNAKGLLTAEHYLAEQRDVFLADGSLDREAIFTESMEHWITTPKMLLNDQRRYYFYDNQQRQVASALIAKSQLGTSGSEFQGWLETQSYNRQGLLDTQMAYANSLLAKTATINDWYALLANLESAQGAITRIETDLMRNQIPAAALPNRVTRYAYDEQQRLISETDFRGSESQYRYDDKDQLIEIVRGVGSSDQRVNQYTYNAAGQTIHENEGDAAAGAIGESQSVIATTHGKQQRYDSQGRLIAEIDEAGHERYFYYDVSGRVVLSINALGYAETWDYNAFGEVVSQRQHSQAVTGDLATLSGGLIDDSVLMRLQDHADDRITASTFNRRGLLTTSASANSIAAGELRQLEQFYSAYGELARRETLKPSALNAGERLIETYAYDNRGLVEGMSRFAQSAPTEQRESVIAWDAFGRKVLEQNEQGQTIAYRYDGQNLLLAETGNHGGDKHITYDTFGRVLTTADVLGHTSSFRYDDTLRAVSVTTSDGFTSTSRKNQFGETIELTSAEGVVSRFDYDNEGRLIRRETGGLVEDREYDIRDNVVLVTQVGGLQTRYEYDALKRQVSMAVDPEGLNLVTLRQFDGFNQVVQEIDPRGNVKNFEFDHNGNLTLTVIDPSGLALRHESVFDANNRELQVTQRSGNTATTGRSRVTTDYNAFDEVVAVRNGFDDSARESRLIFNERGQLTQEWGLDGSEKRYVYDDSGRVRFQFTAMEENSAGVMEYAVIGYEYDAKHRIGKTIAYTTGQTWADLSADSWSGRIPSALEDRVSRIIYDSQDRQRFVIDGEGRINETVFNGDGQIIETIAHATLTVGLSLDWETATAEVVSEALRDDHYYRNSRHTYTLYDAFGRQQGVVNAEGYLSEFIRDESGRIIEQVHYGRRVRNRDGSNGEITTLDIDSLRPSHHNDDRREFSFFDGAGRRRFVVDVAGNIDAGRSQFQLARVTEYEYDANGNQTESLAYATYRFNGVESGSETLSSLVATLKSASGQLESIALSDLRPGQSSIEAEQNHRTESNYDAANRQNMHLSETGLLTLNDYDALGRIIHSGQAESLSDFMTEARITAARYDDYGQLIQNIDAESVRRVGFDNIDALTGERLEYDDKGRVIAAIDQKGQRTVFYYQTNGWLRYAINAAGEVKEYDYNTFGEKTEEWHYLSRMTDLSALTGGDIDDALLSMLPSKTADNTIHQRWRYNEVGQMTEHYDGVAMARGGSRAALQLTYNSFGETAWAIDNQHYESGVSMWHGLYYTNDRLGQTLSTTEYGNRNISADGLRDNQNRFSSVSYNAHGQIISSIDAMGERTVFERDAFGRQLSKTHGLGSDSEARVSATYDVFNRLLTETVPGGGAIKDYQYDQATNTVIATTAAGIRTSTERNHFGEVVAIRDHAGTLISQYEYNHNGKVLASIDGENNRQENEYDEVGNIVTLIDAKGQRVELEYDAENRKLRETVDPSGLAISTEYVFDGAGRNIRIINGKGVETQQRFDDNGRLLESWADPEGLGLLTQYEYDHQGNRIAELRGHRRGGVTEISRETRYQYDSLNRRIYITLDPGGLAIRQSSRLDKNDNIIETTDAGGNQSHYVYDAHNRQRFILETIVLGNPYTGTETSYYRITEKRFDDQGNQTATISYAAPIALDAITDFDYDTVKSQLSVYRSVADRISIKAFDADNRERFALSPVGALTENRYNERGELALTIAYAKLFEVRDDLNLSDLETLTMEVEGNPDNRLTHHFYDNAGRQTHVVNALGGVTQYDYDVLGNVVATSQYANLIDPRSGDLSELTLNSEADRQSFAEFDAANRLIREVDAERYVTTYDYDEIGNIEQKKRYHRAISEVPDAGASITIPLGHALDRSESYLHDAANRQIAVLNERRYVTRFAYNDLGQKISQVHHYRMYTGAWENDALASANTHALDREMAWDYDAAGRVTAQHRGAEGEGRTSMRYTYDELGNVTHIWDYNGNATLFDYNAAGQVTREVKQASSSALGLLWANGYVKDLQYNTFGELVVEKQYVNAASFSRLVYENGMFRPVANSIEAMTPTANTDSLTGDRVTNYSYDALGRQVRVDLPPMSGRRISLEKTFDTFGNEIERVEAGGRNEERIIRKTYDALNRQTALFEAVDTEVQAVTRYRYDAFDRIAVIDPRAETLLTDNAVWAMRWRVQFGFNMDASMLNASEREAITAMFTATMRYDGLGRLIEQVRAHWSADTNVLAEVPMVSQQIQYNAFDEVIANTDAAGNTHYYYRDDLGRVIWEVDKLGFATYHQYNANNEVTFTRVYANAITEPFDENTLYYQINGKVNADRSKDGVTTYNRDALGRVISKSFYVKYDTYLSRYYEYFTYDAMSNVLSHRDKQGYTTTYTYDALNRKISETLPSTEVVTGIEGRTATATSQQVINRLEYNSLGQVSKVIEADNIADQRRVTRFEYDKLGRQVRETREDVEVFSLYSTTPRTVESTIQRQFDAHGNLLAETDAGGGTVRHYYNGQNQRIATVDQQNYLHTKMYDARGNVVEERTYANAVAAADIVIGGSVPRAPSGHQSRIINYWYDGKNQVIRSATNSGIVFDLENGFQNTSIATQTTYDHAGRITSITDGNGAQAYQFYDALGQEILSIDPLGYATRKDYDGGQGRITREHQYANKPSETQLRRLIEAGDVAGLLALYEARASNDDRIKEFDYDLMGRMVKERLLSVEYWTTYNASSPSHIYLRQYKTFNYDNQIGTGVDEFGREYPIYEEIDEHDIETAYHYNGRNQLLRVDNPDGTQILIAYDNQGRKISETSSRFTDYQGRRTAEQIFYRYNAHGELVESRKAGESSERQILHERDRWGQIRTDHTAGSDYTEYFYDTNGRVIHKIENLRVAGGANRGFHSYFNYDRKGQQTWTRDSTGVTTAYRYNAYGDVTDRGRYRYGAAQYQENFEYDSFGRLRKTNADDGVTKLYYYDRNGNNTIEIHSGNYYDADGINHNSDYALSTLNLSRYQLKIKQFDMKGQVTAFADTPKDIDNAIASGLALHERFEAYRENVEQAANGHYLDGSIRLALGVERFRYNAFGDTVRHYDKRGVQTQYRYDERGKLIEEILPGRTVYDGRNQTSRYVTPTIEHYYDEMGRKIGGENEAGRREDIMHYIDGRLVTKLRGGSAAYGRVDYEYDRMGEVREERRRINNTDYIDYSYTYDVYGNKNTIRRRLHQSTANLATPHSSEYYQRVLANDTYIFNSRGDRLYHFNGASRVEQFEYDAHRRITKHRSYAGVETLYYYTFNNEHGGWRTTQTLAGGDSLIDQEDYFGRNVSHTDLGGREFISTYNHAGRKTSRAYHSMRVDYTYFDNGLMKSENDVRYGRRHDYDYDQRGNRTLERFRARNIEGDWETYQDTTATYDYVGRLTQLRDAGNYQINYQYDARDNRTQVRTQAFSDSGTQSKTHYYGYDYVDRLSAVWFDYMPDKKHQFLKSYQYNSLDQRVGATKRINYREYYGVTNFSKYVEKYQYNVMGQLDALEVDVELRGLDARGREDAGNHAPYAKRSASKRYVVARSIDRAGHLTRLQEYNVNKSTLAATVKTDNRYSYNYDGRIYNENDVKNSRSISYTYDEKNRLSRTQTSGYDDDITTDYSYLAYDSYKESTKTASLGRRVSTGRHYYDIHGNLTRFTERDTGGSNPTERDMDYVLAVDGRVVYREGNDISAGYTNSKRTFFYHNGIGVGDKGYGSELSEVDYGEELALSRQLRRSPNSDLNYTEQQMSSARLGRTPNSYSVVSGDTLASIAAKMWGDSSLWYLIADANGLEYDSTLPTGFTLTIPNTFTGIHNNIETFRPYDAGKALGDLSVSVPSPAPPSKTCAIVASVIIAVVAAVISVVSMGSLAAVVGAGAAILIGGIIGGAVAAVANAATQGVMMATGLQKEFSWAKLGSAAAVGFVGGMLGGAAGSAISGAQGISEGAKFVLNIATTAATAVVNEGVSALTYEAISAAEEGRQFSWNKVKKRFDWRSVAVGAIGGVVNGVTSQAYSGLVESTTTAVGRIASEMAKDVTAELINEGVRSAIYEESYNWVAIAKTSLSSIAKTGFGILMAQWKANYQARQEASAKAEALARWEREQEPIMEENARESWLENYRAQQEQQREQAREEATQDMMMDNVSLGNFAGQLTLGSVEEAPPEPLTITLTARRGDSLIAMGRRWLQEQGIDEPTRTELRAAASIVAHSMGRNVADGVRANDEVTVTGSIFDYSEEQLDALARETAGVVSYQNAARRLYNHLLRDPSQLADLNQSQMAMVQSLPRRDRDDLSHMLDLQQRELALHRSVSLATRMIYQDGATGTDVRTAIVDQEGYYLTDADVRMLENDLDFVVNNRDEYIEEQVRREHRRQIRAVFGRRGHSDMFDYALEHGMERRDAVAFAYHTMEHPEIRQAIIDEQINARMAGIPQFLGGLLEAGGGLAIAIGTSWSGVGAVAGVAVTVHGLDNVQAGFHTMMDGQQHDSFMMQAWMSTGMSRENATIVDTVSFGLIGGVGGAARAGLGTAARVTASRSGLSMFTRSLASGAAMSVGMQGAGDMIQGRFSGLDAYAHAAFLGVLGAGAGFVGARGYTGIQTMRRNPQPISTQVWQGMRSRGSRALAGMRQFRTDVTTLLRDEYQLPPAASRMNTTFGAEYILGAAHITARRIFARLNSPQAPMRTYDLSGYTQSELIDFTAAGLEANTTYRWRPQEALPVIDSDGTVVPGRQVTEIHWITDGNAQVRSLYAAIELPGSGSHRTGASLQTRIGNEGLAGDVGFHLIGHQFDGPINRLNVVRGDGRLNVSAWKRMENMMAKTIRRGDHIIEIGIDIERGADGRPSAFHSSWMVSGDRAFGASFNNHSGETFTPSTMRAGEYSYSPEVQRLFDRYLN